MRNPTLTHLREAVRNEITQAFDCLGYAKPRDIAKLVCTANPESIAAIGAQLAENAITDVARRESRAEGTGHFLAAPCHSRRAVAADGGRGRACLAH